MLKEIASIAISEEGDTPGTDPDVATALRRIAAGMNYGDEEYGPVRNSRGGIIGVWRLKKEV